MDKLFLLRMEEEKSVDSREPLQIVTLQGQSGLRHGRQLV